MKKYTHRYLKTVDPSFEAEPMTYGEFAERYGSNSWTETESDREGYARKMHAGEMDWVERDIFEHVYSRCVGMPFSSALDLAKAGNRVTRQAWVDGGMFVVCQKGYPKGVPCNKQTADVWGLSEGDLFKCNPYLQIRLPDGSHSMWVPSMDDLMAEDWMILEEAVA